MAEETCMQYSRQKSATTMKRRRSQSMIACAPRTSRVQLLLLVAGLLLWLPQKSRGFVAPSSSSSSASFRSSSGTIIIQSTGSARNAAVLVRLFSTKSSTPTGQKNKRSPSSATSHPAPAEEASSSSGARNNSSRSSSTRFHAVQALMPRRKKQQGTACAVDRLESSLSYGQLSLRDRSFCRLMVTTTERRLGQIDAVLAACSSRKPRRRLKNRSDRFVQAVLRVGAVQLLFLGVPPHAAVKETVDVLRMTQYLSGAGDAATAITVSEAQIKYAHAVLRRIAREGPEAMLTNANANNNNNNNNTDDDDDDNNNNSKASVHLNAAPWLVEEWRDAWGNKATEQILTAAMSESPRCLTVNRKVVAGLIENEYPGNDNKSDKPTPEQYVADLFTDAEILPQGSIRVSQPPPGPISTWPLYQAGAWWCQDPAATLPAIALCETLRRQDSSSSSRSNNRHRSYHVVDLCAAPGGKTAQLCNYGDLIDRVTAIEISPRRSERLAQNRERLRMDWQPVVADAREWVPTATEQPAVDAVLLDVPCTATGTASKRPDVLRRDADLTELLQVQQALARHAANRIVPVGGILVYATCSLLKQESEDQVLKLLHQNRNAGAQLETVPFEPGEIPGFDDCIDSNGWMRVIPGALPGSLGQCDGFFVARLKRIA